MTYNDIKKFSDRVTYHSFFTMSKDKDSRLKEGHQVNLDMCFALAQAMREGKQFDITKDMIKWIKSSIPFEFIQNNCLVIYYNNLFWLFNFDSSKAVPAKEQPNAEYIYDMNTQALGRFAERLYYITSMLQDEVAQYEKSCVYDPNFYTKVVKVEEPSAKYDTSYSLTRDESEEMSKWQEQHSKKYHKPRYKGAIGVSDYVVRFGSTSIGVYADCYCTECEKEYERTHDENIKKRMSYEIRGL